MHAAGRKSSNSSDDDDEELSAQRKKHFLDYDYGDDSIGESHGKINAAHVSTRNALAANQLEATKKKTSPTTTTTNAIIDRPTTSSMSTKIDQLSNGSGSSSKSVLTNGNKNNGNSNSNNVETVYSILSMLGSYSSSSDELTSKFLEFSKNREMCATLRQSGCISLLVQIIHSDPNNESARQKQCLQTLHNIIHCNADDKAGRREARVMKLIEQLFDYCDALRLILRRELSDDVDRHPIQAIGTLMKISFDEEHRHAMCSLGALQTISTLIQLDHAAHPSSASSSNSCITMRRYAGMCLTNLTFGDGNNKALLCSNKNFMRALVDQINSNSDELVQVTASVIRNLSWRADTSMKQALNEIETIKILMSAAMKCAQENTLKAILSALWNLSNHCAKNKAEICDTNGAIEFLIDMLSYDAPSKTMSVIENAGGILRNISTHMAMYERYRVTLRQKGCFAILLQQLKSPSLTVVSNACGTLGNLSAHSGEDQKYLRENGAIPMLRSLIYSKHKMISTGSTIALRHLLACKASLGHGENLDSVAKMMDLKELPTLNVRKQRALEQELSLNARLEETSPSSKDDKTKDFVVGVGKQTTQATAEMKVQNIEDDDDNDEEDEDAPTNFSKFDTDQEASDEKCEYQVDQITDYSLRYGREEEGEEDEEVQKRRNIISADDTTKCYDTEGTPHTISKAGSMSDLRKAKEAKKTKGKFSANASGVQTPDKPTNYCVEGTPGNFSRNDSLSDLEEASTTPPPAVKSDASQAGPSKSSITKNPPPPPLSIHKKEASGEKDSVAATPKSVTFVNLAEETPLMFSRTSSMGSLSSAEPACDDKSSVVSDFSRMASGIMSPSELPDSPTQSIPQSPSQSRSHVPKPAQRSVPVIKAPQPAARREIIGAEAAEDSTNTFNVENTPAVFSSRTSLSNLSFDDEPKISTDAISKDFQLMKHPSEDEEQKAKRAPQDITAEHSDAESSDDNILLESCINMGINHVVNKETKPTDDENENATAAAASDAGTSVQDTIKRCHPQMLKENPMDMLRSVPLLPPYLPVDEINRFIVEDTPCNFSLVSGLSDITIESNVNTSQPQQPITTKPTAKVEPTIRSEDGASASTSKKPLPPAEFDDSLSSLSLESDDDANLLNQAIAAGVQNKQPKKQQEISNPINIPAKPRPSAEMANDSISSVDSCGRDDASNSILEQCIRSGINKVVKKDSAKGQRPLMTSSPKKSMLPQPKAATKSPQKKAPDQSLKDEELLKECIVSGMLKTQPATTRPDPLAENFSKITLADPKNAETSVIATDAPCAITDVGEKTSDESSSRSTMQCSNDPDENTASESERSLQAIWTMQNGSSGGGAHGNFEWSQQSNGSMDDILERSNEYPANKLSMLACGDLDEESIMDVSNEFMIENEKFAESRTIEDKHKNPDLMLKSVDRLTQELVSTAEYLRKNALDELSDRRMSGSISNNTWNDEISFPSISMTAPMIGSTNDETTFATDQVCSLPEEKSGGSSEEKEKEQLNEETPTNEQFRFEIQPKEEDTHDSPSLDFKVGGEIASHPSLTKLNFLSCGPASIDTLSSTMSNSTIVQAEAKRIANKLAASSKLMDSTTSLDLENVRPPSSMDSISLCSFQDLSVQQSPLRAHPKKSLMTGLVAKRALGHQMFGGSVDSVNSINNIESIRPPSIMDELLDSMISVDSIVSEVVDPTLGISNYETALSDMEDSITLRSCQDLSKDETLTPISSDFSSVESTPKKKRSVRAESPKQKRQAEKDRYRTYTIAIEQQEQECSSTESGRRSLNARQRRNEDRQRFETQVIDHSPELSSSPCQSVARRKDDPERFKTYCIDNDEDFSIRAMTANFEFIRTEAINVASNVGVFDQSGLRNKLNRIKSAASNGGSRQSDESIDYEHQTSETESQRDLKNAPESSENIVASDEEEQQQQQAKPKQAAKSSYISPYRMTTTKAATVTKSKSVRATKTPVIAKVVTPRQSPQAAAAAVSAKTNLANGKTNGAKSKLGVIPKIPLGTPAKLSANAHSEPTTPLIRQGTFVKDEPTNENVPVVDNDIQLPTPKSALSKIKPPSRIASATAKTSADSKNSSPKRTSSIPSSIAQLKYRSNSNASMKIKEISTPVRSATGINLNNPKRNVTSKIAGIWKNNERREVALRKPISTSSTQLNGGSKLSTPTGNVNRKLVNSPTKETRIKRSSTCDEIV